jgi:hypothetical protein
MNRAKAAKSPTLSFSAKFAAWLTS